MRAFRRENWPILSERVLRNFQSAGQTLGDKVHGGATKTQGCSMGVITIGGLGGFDTTGLQRIF